MAAWTKTSASERIRRLVSSSLKCLTITFLYLLENSPSNFNWKILKNLTPHNSKHAPLQNNRATAERYAVCIIHCCRSNYVAQATDYIISEHYISFFLVMSWCSHVLPVGSVYSVVIKYWRWNVGQMCGQFVKICLDFDTNIYHIIFCNDVLFLWHEQLSYLSTLS